MNRGTGRFRPLLIFFYLTNMKARFLFFLIPAIALFITASYRNAEKGKDTSRDTVEFTDANFQSKALSSDKLTIVDFWAEWCGPCRAIGPVIEELSKEYDGKINVGKVNVDHNPQLSINYGVTSIPAILFIKGGKVVDKLVGAQPKSNFVKKIEQHI